MDHAEINATKSQFQSGLWPRGFCKRWREMKMSIYRIMPAQRILSRVVTE